MIVTFGAIGFGLVWGWLLGFYDIARARRPEKLPATVTSLAGASVLGAGVTALLGGFSASASFSVAALTALFVHSQWRSELRKRQRNSINP